MRSLRSMFHSLALIALAAGTAQAHFIWVVAEPAEQPTQAKVYLSEEAAPDDPDLLEKIATAKSWIAGGRGKPVELTLKREGDALVADVSEKEAERPIVVNHTYGVMTRGANPFLLKYYAKTYPSQLAGSWKPVGKAELLPLEVNPELRGHQLNLTVTWEGKPAAGCQVTVEGPGIKEKIQGDTNEQGQFTADVSEPGLYSIRARKEEATTGELDGKKYDQVKHYSTLALHLSPARVTTFADKWPELSQGRTSFGAAIVGDSLYTYGGHLGGAHEYRPEDQSNEFQRLKLDEAGAWEKLPSGPKRTGLAMVAHGGKLYRIGGFEVVGEGQDNLESKSDFARFDPAINAWEELPALPEGRSSHDAVVIGDTLYVAGGWAMKPGTSHDESWLKSAWSCDLSQPQLEWKALPPSPFERRAISLGTHAGKLYVIGGMQSSGGPTTRVDIYDPATGAWTQGPSILGGAMDGFGTASFAVDDQLYTTTMSGSIQKLADDGSRWEVLGQLAHPRFFHEIAPWHHDIVVVGGASMETGKVNALELIPLSQQDVSDQKAALAR